MCSPFVFGLSVCTVFAKAGDKVTTAGRRHVVGSPPAFPAARVRPPAPQRSGLFTTLRSVCRLNLQEEVGPRLAASTDAELRALCLNSSNDFKKA